MTRSFAAISAAIGLSMISSFAMGAADDAGTFTVEEARDQLADAYSLDRLMNDFDIQIRETETPWTHTDETITFRGPYVHDVLAEHGLDEGDAVRFTAFDDFVSEIRLEEIEAHEPILAIERECDQADRQDGTCSDDQQFRPLSMDESGPIFIVWPYDDLPSSYVPARNSIWVWFVVSVRPAGT